MSDGKLYDVFLSYNAQDKEAVEELARRLQDEAGLMPWLDRWNLVPGESWQEPLERALDASRSCVVFLGPSGIGPWQNEEMRSALQMRVSREGFRVIPVLLPGAHVPGGRELPPFLSRLTWVDFSGLEGLKDELPMHRLVAGIRGLAPGRREGASPAAPTRADGGQRRARRKALRILLLTLAAAVALLFIIWLSLPRVAVYYNEQGLSNLERGDLTAAARYFRLAIVLSPSYAQAHYNLAAVYESWRRDDDAIYEYSRAVELDGRAGRPWNNLARLYIKRGRREDLDRAFALINEALKQTLVTVDPEQSPSDAPLLYSLYKNLGWANYELGRRYTEADHKQEKFAAAENDLRHAVALRDKGDADQGAAAHCLLGYVLEAENKPEAAQHWDDCLTYAPGQDDVETEWLDDARGRQNGGAKP